MPSNTPSFITQALEGLLKMDNRPRSDQPFAKEFIKLRDRSSYDSTAAEDDDSSCPCCKCCVQLGAWSIIFLRIITVASTSLLLFDSCSIGYIYDYLLKTVIISGVTMGTSCLCTICMCSAVVADSYEAYALFKGFFLFIIVCLVLAQTGILLELFGQRPEDTIIFLESFWNNPIFPLNCTEGQDRTYVDIGMGLVKYDSFASMLMYIVLAFLCVSAVVLKCLGVPLETLRPWKKGGNAQGATPESLTTAV